MKQTPNVPADGSDKYIQNCGLALRRPIPKGGGISYTMNIPVFPRISRGGGESPSRSGARRPAFSSFSFEGQGSGSLQEQTRTVIVSRFFLTTQWCQGVKKLSYEVT